MMLFPDVLLNSPLFGIGLTVILYVISESSSTASA